MSNNCKKKSSLICYGLMSADEKVYIYCLDNHMCLSVYALDNGVVQSHVFLFAEDTIEFFLS